MYMYTYDTICVVLPHDGLLGNGEVMILSILVYIYVYIYTCVDVLYLYIYMYVFNDFGLTPNSEMVFSVIGR